MKLRINRNESVEASGAPTPCPKYFQSDLISVCSRVFVNNGEARFSGGYGWGSPYPNYMSEENTRTHRPAKDIWTNWQDKRAEKTDIRAKTCNPFERKQYLDC